VHLLQSLHITFHFPARALYISFIAASATARRSSMRTHFPVQATVSARKSGLAGRWLGSQPLQRISWESREWHGQQITRVGPLRVGGRRLRTDPSRQKHATRLRVLRLHHDVRFQSHREVDKSSE
jgi:hypothetical protein